MCCVGDGCEKRGGAMAKLMLGVVGLIAIAVAVSVAPDIRRYIKISTM